MASISFLLGILLFNQSRILPDIIWSSLLLILIPYVIYTYSRELKWPNQNSIDFDSSYCDKSVFRLSHYKQLICFFAVGYLWALLHAGIFYADELFIKGLDGQDLLAEGTIDSIPSINGRSVRFSYYVDSLKYKDKLLPFTGRLQLSWYGKFARVQAGEKWRLLIRVKQPYGNKNPGGFDYEAWLFLQNIHATGYVRNSRNHSGQLINSRVERGYDSGSSRRTFYHWINAALQLRQYFFSRISTVLTGNEYNGLIAALAIGERQNITQQQWQTLRQTGTSHLMAISGLHIGLVAGFSFFLVKIVWRYAGTLFSHGLLARLCLTLVASRVAAIAAIMTAFVYAVLAGFSVPTQRALVMVIIIMLSVFFKYNVRPSQILATALLLVLIADPFASLEGGFWLSFIAVTVILFAMSNRIDQKNIWWKWGRVQVIVLIGLIPVMLVLFQQISVISPLANIVAVPWVSFVIVPLTLLGSIFIEYEIGEQLIVLSADSFNLLWLLFERLLLLPVVQWQQAAPVSWTIVPAVLGVIYWLMPSGVPVRWIAGILLLPIFLVKTESLQTGQLIFTLLDVGQGLSAVVQSKNHVLVYDTGPGFSKRINAGTSVILPFLSSRGITHVDRLILSHGDNDHIGGLNGLKTGISIGQIISGEPVKISKKHPELKIKDCTKSNPWDWDEVNFEIIYPSVNRNNKSLKGNNRSCVLKVSNSSGDILLTGDIELPAENFLLEGSNKAYNSPTGAYQLAADILVVPHHGSKTSSTSRFVAAVKPQYSLLPIGYKNKFSLPNRQVVKRYKAIGSNILDTASSGAIEFRLFDPGVINPPQRYRIDSRRFFNH